MPLLSIMHAQLFATIVENALSQLRFLAQGHNDLHTYKAQQDIDELRRQKYNVEPWDVGETEQIDYSQLECDGYKLKKLFADRMVCENVLMDTYLELSVTKTHKPLENYIQGVKEETRRSLSLTDDEAQNKIVRRDMARQVRLQRNRFKSMLYDISAVIDKLLLKFKDADIRIHTEDRYIDKWQDCRSEQNTYQHEMKQTQCSESIANYRIKFDEEQRVHSDLDLFINININEIYDKVRDVMNMYDTDIELMEAKVQRIHTNYDDQLAKRFALEKKLAEHQAQMDDWLQFKKDREMHRLYSIKMHHAAIIVQAWWRGLLVRKNLGPFKMKKMIQKSMMKKAKKA